MSEVKKGRKVKADPVKVAAWRQARKASIAETAKRFGISEKTVSNYCRDFGEEAERQREQWRIKREHEEWEELESEIEWYEMKLRWVRAVQEEAQRNPTPENHWAAIAAANSLVPKAFRFKKPGQW